MTLPQNRIGLNDDMLKNQKTKNMKYKTMDDMRMEVEFP